MQMRWMRWLCGLFGAMWLLITGVLWTGRPPDGRLQDVLLSTPTNTYYSYALATIGDIRARQLTPLSGDFLYGGWSRDWQWLYFIDTPMLVNHHYESSVYRVSASGKSWHLFDNIDVLVLDGQFMPLPNRRLLYWTPNHQWAVYTHTVDNQASFVTRSEAGTQVVNAAESTTWASFVDNEWVYFDDYSDTGIHLFRARLDGGGLENLTQSQSGNFSAVYFDLEANLILVRQTNGDQSTLASMAFDGSNFQTLHDTTGDFLSYLPAHQLVFTYDSHATLIALSAKDGKMMWRKNLDFLGVILVSPDENTLYFFSDYGQTVRRIEWDGTGLTTLYTLNSSQTPLNFDPTSETLLYIQTHNNSGPYEIWRRIPKGSSQKLASFPYPIRWQGSPSDDWVIFNVPAQPYPSTYRIHPDGTGLERILNGPSWWNYVEAFGPKWELQWQPPSHAILGAVLLIISLLRLPKAWNRRSITRLN